MLFYIFCVSGVDPDHTGVQTRKIFRRRAKSALGHDKLISVKRSVARPLSEFARTFTKFNTRILPGETDRQFLIVVDLPRLAKSCDVSVFAVSELANFIRRIIEDVGWKIEGEALISSRLF